jgi:hypothetical protein
LCHISLKSLTKASKLSCCSHHLLTDGHSVSSAGTCCQMKVFEYLIGFVILISLVRAISRASLWDKDGGSQHMPNLHIESKNSKIVSALCDMCLLNIVYLTRLTKFRRHFPNIRYVYVFFIIFLKEWHGGKCMIKLRTFQKRERNPCFHYR